MKRLVYHLVLIVLAAILIGCKTKTIYVPVKETETITETIRDTIIDVQLVPYKDSIVTKDTVSYLNNKYAYSWAKWSNGMLYHSLGILDVKHPVEIKYVDREVKKEIQVPYPVKGDTEYINRLTSFQSFQIWCGRILLLLIIGYLGFRYLRFKI